MREFLFHMTCLVTTLLNHIYSLLFDVETVIHLFHLFTCVENFSG